MLRRLIDAGVDGFRLNFSHGTHEEHSAIVANIRSISRQMERHVAILQDLCRPKMRLDPFPGDVLECRLNDEFTLVDHVTTTGPGILFHVQNRRIPPPVPCPPNPLWGAPTRRACSGIAFSEKSRGQLVH